MELKGRKGSKMGEREEGKGGGRREGRMQGGDELLIPFKAASQGSSSEETGSQRTMTRSCHTGGGKAGLSSLVLPPCRSLPSVDSPCQAGLQLTQWHPVLPRQFCGSTALTWLSPACLRWSAFSPRASFGLGDLISLSDSSLSLTWPSQSLACENLLRASCCAGPLWPCPP